jgi:hypothetical protein
MLLSATSTFSQSVLEISLQLTCILNMLSISCVLFLLLLLSFALVLY